MADLPPLIIGDRAFADILLEVVQHLSTETGGILLGVQGGERWYVLESLDPGPKAIRQPAYFEYDHAYVNHLANVVCKRYMQRLSLIGLWHRHPGSFDQFSGTDDSTHTRYLAQADGRIISCLVNLDPTFRLSPFVVSGTPPRHQRIRYLVGDEHFPTTVRAEWGGERLKGFINQPPTVPATLRSAPNERRIGSSINIISPQRPDEGAEETSPRPKISVSDPLRTFEKFWQWILRQMNRIVGSNTPGTPAEYPGTNLPSPSPAGEDTQKRALDMLDSEYDFLDSQPSLEYELAMSPLGVHLTVRRTVGNGAGPHEVRLLLTADGSSQMVKYGDRSYQYQAGVVESILKREFV